MSDIRQPMPRPTTFAAYLSARPRMVDTHGNLLRSEHCARCAQEHFTVEPCASEAPCPQCGSSASRCRRPSGHDATEWHAARRSAFETLCAEREAAGLPQVALWPETAAPL